MPLEIVRNDITNMQVDAIVNTVSSRPGIGYGVDSGIHKKAGPRLLIERVKIGSIPVGTCAISPAFQLDAKYVIHAVGPTWRGGNHGEVYLLRQCYDNALALALAHDCKSIAFPLMSAGNRGFPANLALQIAIAAFSTFLLEHEMQIYLVVFGKEAFSLSKNLFPSVASYIDENYILDKTLDEYDCKPISDVPSLKWEILQRQLERGSYLRNEHEWYEERRQKASSVRLDSSTDLDTLLREADISFSEALLELIERTGKKDCEIYKKANIDRKLFSKIRNNPDYKPSKTTALAFALALELDLDETQNFIRRAGYALTHSSKLDIIVEYFILNKNYNIMELNLVLFEYDQPLIGSI